MMKIPWWVVIAILVWQAVFLLVRWRLRHKPTLRAQISRAMYAFPACGSVYCLMYYFSPHTWYLMYFLPMQMFTMAIITSAIQIDRLIKADKENQVKP